MCIESLARSHCNKIWFVFLVLSQATNEIYTYIMVYSNKSVVNSELAYSLPILCINIVQVHSCDWWSSRNADRAAKTGEYKKKHCAKMCSHWGRRTHGVEQTHASIAPHLPWIALKRLCVSHIHCHSLTRPSRMNGKTQINSGGQHEHNIYFNARNRQCRGVREVFSLYEIFHRLIQHNWKLFCELMKICKINK